MSTLKKIGRQLAAVLALLCASIVAAQQQPTYQVHGPSQLDVSACASVTPTTGSTSVTFWVIRAPTVTGPTQISATNLPPGVAVTISPDKLTYPGWAIGQQFTVQVSTSAGVVIPDTVITLTASDQTSSANYELLLHGACPRNSKAFTVRGSFFSNHLGTIYPVEGAVVEIYRDVAWAVDPWVGRTTTRADGTFETNIWTGIEATYYAKLRLNDGAGVYLRDGGSPEILGYNSVNRGVNSVPLVDLGGTLISRDNGTGTPKTALWQGGRAAFQEFIQSVGTTPPTGDYEIVIQWTKHRGVWTARSTTNWEDNVQTYKWLGSPRSPTDQLFDPYFTQFETYSTNFHEFGHALRHTVDGDMRHLSDDASRWTYIRGHTLCGSDAGQIETEAYGFNEGWSEYWGRATRADLAGCAIDLTDLTIEGSVANDMISLAETLQTCLPLAGSAADIMRAQRRSMFAVINRGQNIMHSQGEFRNHFLAQYPSCSLPTIGVAVNVNPLQQTRWRPGSSRYDDYYQQEIAFRKSEGRRLSRELDIATREARAARVCRDMPCETYIASVIKPHILRGQKQYSDLIGRTYQARYEQERLNAERPPAFTDEAAQRERGRLRDYRKELEKITLGTLQSAASALDRNAASDATGEIRAASADLKRTARRLALKAPLNDELFTILKLPPGPNADRVTRIAR